MTSLLQTKIEYLPGVGPQKALLLQQELRLYTFEDLLHHYPFRYQDRSRVHKVSDLSPRMSYAQLRGTIDDIRTVKTGKKRLLASLRDETGAITLIWFKGLTWMLQKLQPGVVYTVFGRMTAYGQQMSLVHPELEVFGPEASRTDCLFPVYYSTEKLKGKICRQQKFGQATA